MTEAKNPNRSWVIGVGLAAITLVLFWPVTSHEFISYDDRSYILDNPHVTGGLSLENIKWAFTTGHAANWHPLTWLSHMLDVELFGLRPGWHHGVSALIHAVNTALVFWLWLRLTGARWRSAFVAALFGWHPLHVESVAWAAERKDLLCALFGLLTLQAWTQYAMSPAGARRKWTYLLALAAFAIGLMCKPMLVTLPCLFLLLDWWPLKRVPAGRVEVPEHPARAWTRLVVEKLPFFALTIISCAMTLVFQSRGGAVMDTQASGLLDRVANSFAAMGSYLTDTVWPLGLSLFYPLRSPVPLTTLVSGIFLVAAATILAVVFRRTRPWIGMGWLWFVGMLVPVLGFVQVGMQQRADRYTYLPLIGLFVALTWDIAERLSGSRAGRVCLQGAAGLALVGCLALTSRQIGYWRDSESIFSRSLAIDRNSYIALYNHGLALQEKGQLEEATRDYQSAIELGPELDSAYLGLGDVYLQQNRLDDAALQFEKILATQPGHLNARIQLGVTRGRQGRLPEAQSLLEGVLRDQPEEVAARNNLGNVLTLQGQNEAALAQFAEVVRLRPRHATAYNNLAVAAKKLGRTQEALQAYRQALAKWLKPDAVESLNNLAWLLAADPDDSVRNGIEAVGLATRACELTRYQHPNPLVTLAAAYGETGQFREAISLAEQTRDLLGGRGPLAGRIEEMLASFRSARPFHAE